MLPLGFPGSRGEKRGGMLTFMALCLVGSPLPKAFCNCTGDILRSHLAWGPPSAPFLTGPVHHHVSVCCLAALEMSSSPAGQICPQLFLAHHITLLCIITISIQTFCLEKKSHIIFSASSLYIYSDKRPVIVLERMLFKCLVIRSFRR